MSNEENLQREAQLANDKVNSLLGCLSGFTEEMDKATQKFRDRTSGSKDLEKVLTDLETAERNYDQAKIQETKARIAEFKHFGLGIQQRIIAARGGNYAQSSQAELTTGHMASLLERTSRVKSFLSGPMGSSFFGPGMGGAAGTMVSGGQDGAFANIQKQLREIAILKSKGELSDSQAAKKVEALKQSYVGLTKTLKEAAGISVQSEQIAVRAQAARESSVLTGSNRLRSVMGGGSAGRAMDSLMSGRVGAAIMNAEEKGSGGTLKGVGGQMASMAMEKLASGIASSIGVLSTAALSFAAVGAAVKMVIEAFDDVRKVQGAAVSAMSAGGSEAARDSNSLATSLMDAVGANSELYHSLEATGQFMPLVLASLSTMGTLGSRSLRGLNGESLETAKAFMAVGIAGTAMGMSVDKSMGLSAALTRAFNSTGKDIIKTFKEYFAVSQMAGQSMDEFGESLGSVVEISKTFGESGARSIEKAFGFMVKGDTFSPVQKLVAQGGLKSMMNAGLPFQAGMAMAGGRGTAGLGELAGSNNVLGFMSGNIMNMVKAAMPGMGTGPTARLAISSMMGQLTNASVGQSMFFEKDKNNNPVAIEQTAMFRAFSSGNTDAMQKAVADAMKAYDPQAHGIDVMEKQVGALEKISLMLENFFKQFAYSGIGKAMNFFQGPSIGKSSQGDVLKEFNSQPRKSK